LVSKCFEVLQKYLKFNIYNIPSSYVLNKDVSGLQERKADTSLMHIHYAALFWTFHLLQCGSMTQEQEKKLYEIFAGPHTLYWMEILSLHGKMYEALRSIQLISVIKVRECQNTHIQTSTLKVMEKKTEEILDDVYHFLDLAKEACSVSIPHIYLSCLPMMPQSCLLAKETRPYFRNILDIEGMPDVWVPHNMVLEGHKSDVNSVAYSPDGRHVVSGSNDHTVRIWDASTGQQVGQPLQGHSRIVTSVAYSPDSRHVVSGSSDTTVRIWDAGTGQQVGQPLQGHSSEVRSVAYSPDGSHPLQGHSSIVTSVAYSPDGRHVVSGSEDNTVRIWDASTGQPL
ncbi:WD40 repeat-like protein, partial [Pluteus cervinus]